MKVLLVEDDHRIAQALADYLSDQLYTVEIAEDGLAAWDLLQVFPYDLLVLDIMLPKLDGIQLCQRLRSQGFTMPVLMLTARDSSQDKVLGLDAGADDYVVKPFDLPEMSARIRALLRRGSTSGSPILEWGNLQLDPGRCQVTYAGAVVPLTAKEINLVELFLRHSQQVLSRRTILDHLWTSEDPPDEEAVKAHVKRLRQKLSQAGAVGDVIETVYGMGYRLKPLS